MTGSGALTVLPPASGAGPVSVFLPATITTVTLSTFNLEIGSDNPSTERWLEIRRRPGGHVTAMWAANPA